jgi:PncC family amidohydrolase
MDDEPLEFRLGELLKQRGWRLAVAESCTGGLVGHRITNIPGSSDYYLGGVIAYANQVKVDVLGVRWETLEQYGAVSAETALEMAQGVRRVLEADIGASITGIAGPGGGSQEKPVGLTWIGLSTGGFIKAWRYVWAGDRLAVKEQSANEVLRVVVAYLADQSPE